jgi:hypothetical protein
MVAQTQQEENSKETRKRNSQELPTVSLHISLLCVKIEQKDKK